MNKDVCLRLQSTTLFKELEKRELEALPTDEKLSAQVLNIVRYVAPLLERIPENMHEYTLHDPNHSAKIVDIIGKIIPPTVLTQLNRLEIALLILSAYLHDIGMTCEKEEKEKIISGDPDFQILFKSDFEKSKRYEQYKSNNDHRSATFIQDQIFTNYLRVNHVKRSAEFIQENLSKEKYELTFNGVPYWKQLIAICNSHGETVKTLKDLDQWPRHTIIDETIVNIQYLSLLLRLGDILDLDAERTPEVIYKYVNPKDPISIIEWKKHRSIFGRVFTAEKILFEAECPSPEVERALREFLAVIENERKETMQLLRTYDDKISEKYFLLLNEEITFDRIKSNKTYIYNDLRFEIDYQRVINLLMGQRLYKNPVVALRELIQNAVDAIRIREQCYEKEGNYKGLIKIDLSEDELIVEDNGIGMNLDVFQKYFLQVGKSYYSSPAFYSKHSQVDVTSEFGIGVLSTFMIARSILIESRAIPENPLNPPQSIHFEIPTAFSYTIQRPIQRKEIGTKITLKLLAQFQTSLKEISSIVSEMHPFPYENMSVYINRQELEAKKAQEFKPFLTIQQIQEHLASSNFLGFHSINAYSLDSTSFLTIDLNTDSLAQDIGIKGKIILCQRSPYRSTRFSLTGIVSQRGFSVGYPTQARENFFSIEQTNSIRKLFPGWLPLHIHVNLTGKSILNITPDRTDFIEDEKFTFLKEKIESIIILHLEAYLETIKKSCSQNFNRYFDWLFSSFSVYWNNNFSETAKAFLHKWIEFPAVIPGAGKTRISFQKLLEEKSVLYTDNEVGASDINLISKFANDVSRVIVIGSDYNNGSTAYTTSSVFYELIGDRNSQGYVTDLLPRFIFTQIEIESVQSDFCAYHSFYPDIRNLKANTSLLFCTRMKFNTELAFNINHPFFSPISSLLKSNLNPTLAKLIDDLQESLGTLLREEADRQLFSDSSIINTLKEDRWKAFDYFSSLTHVLQNTTVKEELIAKCDLFRQSLIENNLIEPNAPKYDLSIKDFPAHWQ